ncbi:MAG: hypothetical protein EOM49_10625 [Epsilonproteobacteria bacterium]|uniref:Uncharacterized protein n=1 Tax=Sulfurospirillum cavolei TaxID=366522 RepID=A0A2D3W630_9BACT|nr:hypothetical protein [Campylobacterota bacterium]DAB36812.1 MAG TPA: hypothetical protein CFH80_02915 [Sulfurospirillum cavolei]
MKKRVIASAILVGLTATSFAHTALMNCMENADGTIGCEAGYSDGSSATGIALKVVQNAQVVLEKKFDANSEVNFKKPQGEYTVIFDGGDGHALSIPSRSILK